MEYTLDQILDIPLLQALQEKLSGKEIGHMMTFNNNRYGIVDHAKGAFVSNSRVGLVQVTQNVLIAYNAFLFRLRMDPVEFCADILPGRCCQYFP